nr:MAG TPA: hypothetical protein [Caudoviricetes sp.]
MCIIFQYRCAIFTHLMIYYIFVPNLFEAAPFP